MNNFPCLDGKVALVTGAGGTMGGAVVHALRADGCRVAMIDLNLTSTAALTVQYGDAVLAIACDIGDPEAVKLAHDQIVSQLGVVEILVNNAGICRTTKSKQRRLPNGGA